MTNIHFSETLIIGGGPAGLFCALRLAEAGIPVRLLDRMEKPGKKFVLAGLSGGLNITNSAAPGVFEKKYFENSSLFRSLLAGFSPEDTIHWYSEMGSGSFRGNGGKIFADKPAHEILDNWLRRLEHTGLYSFSGGYEFTGFDTVDGKPVLLFRHNGKTECIGYDTAVFALGGGSRSRTGSDGSWQKPFSDAGINVKPLSPANCGVCVSWSEIFREKIRETKESAEIIFSTGDTRSEGEAVFTEYGIEGSGIYSLIHRIREELGTKGSCTVTADILPGLSDDKIRERLSRPRGKSSLSNYLRKNLRLSGIKYMLLRELVPAEKLSAPETDPSVFRNLEIRIDGFRPLEEAISSAGGVAFEELDENLMLRKLPGVHVIGEMADWEAPTGGYLLQGCFSMAHHVSRFIIMKCKT